MSRKNALTQHQRDERARRIAMGIAVIQRPLKYIRARTHVIGATEESPEFILASRYAKYGNGAAVKFMARSLS